jgi:hypothetical protein
VLQCYEGERFVRYNYQTIYGNENGDCFRAALSCLLDCEVEAVPHFFDGVPNNGADIIWPDINRWLYLNYKLKIFMIPFQDKLENLLDSMKALNPGIPYLLMASSPTGNHQYVACDDKVIWCPAEGLHGKPVGPCSDGWYWVKVLVKGD